MWIKSNLVKCENIFAIVFISQRTWSFLCQNPVSSQHQPFLAATWGSISKGKTTKLGRNFSLIATFSWDYICCLNLSFCLQLESTSVTSLGALRLPGVWAPTRGGLWLVPLHRRAAQLLHLPCVLLRYSRGCSPSRCEEAGLRAEGAGVWNSLLQSGVF